MKCSSCNVNVRSEENFSKFSCPKCLESVIIRCEIYNNFKEFIKLFHKSICNNSKTYFEFLQKVNKIDKKNILIKNINKKNFIYKTLRMSCLEIKLI